jgi:uncharacterized protein (TIGR02246 family)
MRDQRIRIVRAALMLNLAWLGVWATAGAQGQEGATEKTARFGREPRALVGSKAPDQVVLTNRPEDEKAISAVGESFRRAYNAGDAKAVASLYTDDAELIEENGERFQGRKTIQDVYSSLFQERKGNSIEIAVDSIRFLGPDVGKEEGRTRVKTAVTTEPSSVRRYTVIYVKQGGKWLYSSAREELDPGLAHSERLKELEWLVGDWIDESSESVVHATCRWSADKNFLLRDFTIHADGKSVMTVTQRIGWDPLSKQIKSWVFDSEGGYGDGLWTRNGEQWMIKSSGVLPDGRIATATNILTRVGPNSARWASTERTVGGYHAPDRFENMMVRRPPSPPSQPQ